MKVVKQNRLSGIKFLIFVGIIIISILALRGTAISAVTAPVKWSWIDKAPVVYSSTLTSGIDPGLCSGSYQMKEISGYGDLKHTCMTNGDFMSFGIYDDGSVFKAAIGFGFDSKMYKFDMPMCRSLSDCLYLPETDTLVTKQALVNPYVKSMVIYKNVSQRLIRHVNVNIISGLSYEIDTTKPDYILQSSSGYAWPIGGFGASDNGRWLAVELRGKGLALLDIDTLEMQIISKISLGYGVGLDPSPELAVDNDGSHVVLAGLNVGLRIFEVVNSCGDLINDDLMWDNAKPKNPYCQEATFDFTDVIYRFKTALQPKINADGSEIRFYALSYDYRVNQRQVVVRAGGYEPKQLEYLAMGDSYSSGEGESEPSHYLAGTNDEYENCHTSDRSYPFEVARKIGMDMDYVKSVACSNARTVDIFGLDLEYSGQQDRLTKMSLTNKDKELVLVKDYAKFNFIPGRVQQFYFAKYYEPKAVTIGIGGNDANLMGKLSDCASTILTCDWAKDDTQRMQTAQEIKALYPVLVKTYTEISNKSPDSKIYAIGYPIVITDQACYSIAGRLLNETERRFMIEAIKYLNKVASSAAKAAGIKFIDIENIYGDNVICGHGTSYINAIDFGDSDELVNNANYYKFIHSESFHPTPAGHAMTAQAIINQVGDPRLYDYCKDGSLICPDLTVKAPEPPDYWSPERPTRLYINDTGRYIDCGKKICHVSVNKLIFEPDSIVSMTVHSEAVNIGNFVVDKNGFLDADLSLPEGLKYGYHTVYLSGQSYTGQPISIYRIFLYSPSTISVQSDDSRQIVNFNIQDNLNAHSPVVGKEATISLFANQNESKASTVTNNAEVKGLSKRTVTFSKIENTVQFDIISYSILVAFCLMIILAADSRLWH
ncbi:hypothetical protein HGB24_03505 [Candidatus Saccharibacteria bacterium]|nr:hypothetical protein [Candidatus Saccharibacteria bacterium]